MHLRLLVPSLLLVAAPRAQQFADLDREWLPDDRDTTVAAAFIDLDGDGVPEILLGNGGPTSAEPNRLYRSDGERPFAAVVIPALAVDERTTALAVGDVDGDGRADVVIGNAGSSRLLVQDGSGGLRDETLQRLPAISGLTGALALVDVDGDSDLDLVQVGAGPDRLFRNDGTGHFTAQPTALALEFSDGRAVAAADLDGDSDLDLVVGNTGPTGAADMILENLGTGIFRNLPGVPLAFHKTAAVVVFDVDGDGMLDIVFGNDGADRLLRQVAPMRFADESERLPATSGRTTGLAVHDFDGDSDLDIFLTDFDRGLRLLRNDGGRFSDVSAEFVEPTPAGATCLVLADVDLDQDVDVLVGIAGGRSVLRLDTSRQLDAPFVVPAGTRARVDVFLHGRGPRVVFPYAAVALAHRPFVLPPIGTLRLDLATLVVDRPAVVPPTGRLRLSYGVPRGLHGISVHFQVLTAPGANILDARLTNSVRIDIR